MNNSARNMSGGTKTGTDHNRPILIPILARMMRALEASTGNGRCNCASTSSEELFVSKKSFAAANNKLYGRQPQLKQLQNLFNQMQSPDKKHCSHLALVHGKSGSGKSSLVNAFVKTLQMMSTPILFATGKFDQLKAHLPFAALIKAANDLARKALQSQHANDIKTRLLDELGPEISLLATIVEELSTVVSNQNKETETSASGIGLTEKAMTRCKLLLRSFIRAIASPDTPVIIFFDDLQWADEETMQMLKALLTDKLSNHVMLILAYRDDEMDPEALQKYFSISALNLDTGNEDIKQPTSYGTNVVHGTEIKLPNLDTNALNQMVSAVLNEPEQSTMSLTDIIMNKTQGNPFYALNYMDLLYTNGMLQQIEENRSWEWDESIILQQTDVSDNLAKILEKKILRLPEKIRSILQLAAFIGHDFTSNILTTIVYEEQDMIEGEYSFDLFDKDVIEQWIIGALNLALEEGLVELSVDEETYKFSHDRIQHCLYKDLMPDDVERRLLHQRIGKLIWNTISSQDCETVDDWVLFLAADNLNRGPKFVDEDGNRAEMIELNVRAGKLAASKTAFLVSAEYLRCGEKLITDDNFVKSNYDLCMDLYRTAADMERIVGEFERSHEFAKKIHKYARETEDRFPAYLAEIKLLATRNEMTKSMDLAFKVLKQMGVNFPRKITFVSMVQEFVRIKFMIGKRTPEELMKLPMLTDKKKLFALKLLSSISWYAFFAGESAKFTFVAVSLRMATLTLQDGLSELYAPQAFVGYGTVCCFFGKFDLGLSFGDAAQRLLDRFDAESVGTQFQYLSFIWPWTYGLNGSLAESLQQGYYKSMLVGNIDVAYNVFLMWLGCGYNVATPLDELVKKGTRIRLEMEEHGHKGMLLMTIPLLQSMRIMFGDRLNHNPAVLTGEDMNLEEFKATVNEKTMDTAFCSLVLSEMNLAMHFGDWEYVQTKIPNVERTVGSLEGHFCFPITLASVVWSRYRFYDMTGRKQHRRIGRRHHQTLKRYAKLQSPDAILCCNILTAAKAAFVKKKPIEECEKLFVSVLRDLEKGRNFRMHSFVADELADLFLRKQNKEKGINYLQESMECSARWGAQEKVRFLEKKLLAVRPIEKEI